jgi:hypothetical protein
MIYVDGDDLHTLASGLLDVVQELKDYSGRALKAPVIDDIKRAQAEMLVKYAIAMLYGPPFDLVEQRGVQRLMGDFTFGADDASRS